MDLHRISFCFVLVVISILSSCSKEESLESLNENLMETNANIKPSKLYGSWTVSKLVADVPVDLNNDGTGNTNILLETNCFDSMGVVLNQDKTFSSTNSQMDFAAGASNTDFACLMDRTDSGTWEIQQDQLTLNLVINGISFSQTKTISLRGSRFSFDINKADSNQYVNDPGNTAASNIRILEVEYQKN